MDVGGLSLDLGGGNFVPKLLFWGKWGIIILVVTTIFVMIYFFLQYKYKVTVFVRGGSGSLDDKNTHSIRRISTWERARVIRDKTGMTTHWKLLFARKKIEPVEMKHVYPGNNVFLYKVEADTFVPTDFACSKDEGSFNPIPQHIRRWQTLEIQQAAQDYQTKDAWEKYAPYFMVLGTAACCCVLVGVVIYFSFSQVQTQIPVLERIAGGLSNVNVIPGAPR